MPDIFTDDPFAKLERSHSDPIIEAVYENARTIEMLANGNQELTAEEATELNNELDRMWPHLGEPVIVTGQILSLRIQNDLETEENQEDRSTILLGSDEPSKDYYENVQFISHGFNIIREPIMVDDEEVATRATVMHQFIMGHNSGGSPLYSKKETYYGLARLDEVIVKPIMRSVVSVARELEYDLPDVIDYIDSALLNCKNECEAVKCLAPLSIASSPDDDPSSLQGLQTYVDKLIEFDRQVPYVMTVESDFFVVDEAGVYQLAKPRKAFTISCWISQIQISKMSVKIEEGVQEETLFCLEVIVLGKTLDEDKGVKYVVPCASIQELTNVRSMLS
jgi:hypothetical protein